MPSRRRCTRLRRIITSFSRTLTAVKEPSTHSTTSGAIIPCVRRYSSVPPTFFGQISAVGSRFGNTTSRIFFFSASCPPSLRRFVIRPESCEVGSKSTRSTTAGIAGTAGLKSSGLAFAEATADVDGALTGKPSSSKSIGAPADLAVFGDFARAVTFAVLGDLAGGGDGSPQATTNAASRDQQRSLDIRDLTDSEEDLQDSRRGSRSDGSSGPHRRSEAGCTAH